jgi:hypothetical protein
MGKKLLSLFFILPLFLLNSWDGFGQGCPSSVAISSDPGTTVCQGTPINFSVTATGGTNLIYQWKVDNTQVYSGSNQYTHTNPQQGQQISVIITSGDDANCSLTRTFNSLTVNALRTPTVSIASNKTALCPGESITFNASNTHGGSGAQYQWFINGSNSVAKTGASVSFSSSAFIAGSNSVKVVLTSSLDCVTSATADASFNIELKPDATISSSGDTDKSTCINTLLDPISFNIDGGGTGATATGLPPGVSGSFTSGVFTLSGSPTTAGEFNYTVTTTGSCAQTSASGTIIVNPDATLSLTSGNNNQSICAAGGVANVNIEPIAYRVGETGSGATSTGLPEGITGSYNNGIFTISGSSSEAGIHNFTVTANGSCGNSSVLSGSITIEENLVPSVTITSDDADDEICEGTPVTFKASPSNGGTSPNYQWKIDGNNVGSNSDTFTTSSLSDAEIVTVIMTSNQTCITNTTATSNGISTKVNPRLEPSVSIDPSDTEFCSGDEVVYTAVPVNGGTSPSYQWKVGSTVVGSGATFTTSGLSDSQSVTVTLTSNETCVTNATAISAPIITSVKENLVPSVTIASNDDNNIICAGGSITFNATSINGGATPQYQWQINGNSSGGVTTSNTFNPTNLNNGDKVSVILISSEECLAENNMVSNEISVQVDTSISAVVPVWDSSDPSYNPTAICPAVSGLIFKVEPIEGATSYQWTFPNSSWSITSGNNTNEVVVTAGVNASAGLIKVQASTECGSGAVATLEVSTGTAAYANAGPDQRVCPGTTSIILEGEIGGVITKKQHWNWSSSLPGGTFSSIQGNHLKGQYTLPSSIVNGGSVTITITTIQPSGDCPAQKDEMIITVLSAASISEATNKDQSLCIDSPIDDISFTIGGAGEGAQAVGLPAGITGNFVDGIFTLSGAPTEAGIFNYTVTTTGNCTNVSVKGSLTVNDRPTFTQPVDVFACAGESVPTISFEGNSIAGTTYQWTNDNPSIGLAGTGNGDIVSFQATNTTNAPITANITATAISNNCEGATKEFIITVYPSAKFTIPENITVCHGENSAAIVLTGSNVEGTTYTWANSNTAIGLAAEGTGNIPSFAAINTTDQPIEAIITVTPVANQCQGTPEDFTITVNPSPTFTVPENQAVCDGEAVPELIFAGATVNGTTYSWTNDTPSIGLAASGTGNIPAFTAVNNTNELLTATISVTPKANECEAAPVTFEIVVNPSATVNPVEDMVVCNGEDTSEILISSPVGGTTYTWTNSNPEIGLPASGTGNIPVFSATNISESPINALITIIPSANGCEGTPLTFDITVNPNVIIDAGPDQVICSNGLATMAAVLGGGATAGTWTTSGSGTFNSNAVNATYTPSASDAFNGSVMLTYTSNDPEGPCNPLSDSLELTISQEIVITTQTENIGICSTEPSELSVIATGENLSYQWKRTDNAEITNATGINSSTLSFNNTTSTNAGQYYVVVTGENPCSEAISDPATILVDENIIIEEPITEVPICGDGFSQVSMKFIAHANGEPLTFTWYKGNTIVDDSDPNITITTQPADESGKYEGTLEIINITTDYNGDYYVEIKGPQEFTCSTAVTNPFQLRLNEVPEPPTVENFEFCQFDQASALTVLTGDNLTWYASETGDDPYYETPVPNTAVPGETIYWVSQTPDVCESQRVAVSVNIKEKPATPQTNNLVQYCEGEIGTTLEAVAQGEASLNWYDAQENLLSEAPLPDTSIPGTYLYYVSQSLQGCQSDRVPIEVIIHDLPEVTISASQSLICAGSLVTLTATGADSYVWYNQANEVLSTTASLEINPEITSTYSVIGTGPGDCSSPAEITIEVDQPSNAGTISGATSVCIGNNSGEISVSEISGEVIRWEFTADNGTTWETIPLEASEISASYTYQNLTTTTSFRAVVQNGVCEEVISGVVSIQVDEYPVGGELNFEGFDRLYTTCEEPEILADLIISGHSGQVVAWKYRTASQGTFQTISGETGNILSAETIAGLVGQETIIFQAEVINGTCNVPVPSRTAILSVISSNIEPAPVSVSDDLICLGTQVTLSAETGYESGDGVNDSGNFDNASINQKGWRIINSNNQEENFETSANNTAPNVWRRVTPREFITAELTSPYNTSMQLYDHGLEDSNKGFALVSGKNTSTMETNVFALDGMDSGILTFDQAYNLTPGASIEVLVSTNGGSTYTSLYSNNNDPSSGNYTDFASGTPTTRPENKIEIDLGDYIGQNQLRIMFSFVGARQGDVWAIDNIILPDGPQNVGVIWEDTTDPETPVVIGTNASEPWTPTEIGWNVSVITTTLEYSGGSCATATNNEEIKVFVYDQYTSSVQAQTSSCGNYSAQLTATVTSVTQGEISSYPTLDGYTGKWVVEGPAGYSFSNTDPEDERNPINNPNAIFTSEAQSPETYSFTWVLEPTATDENGAIIDNQECLPIYQEAEVVFKDCIALDFDGVDDYVDLGESYTGTYSVEAWILPFSRTTPDGGMTNVATGTIISGPGFKVGMEDLPAYVTPGNRWYHIAISGGNLFVDGIKAGTISTSGGNRTLIGATWNDTALQAENFFSGYIEEVRIWNTAITVDQIRFMMNQRLYNNGTQMGVEIPMDVPGGLSFADLAGYYQLLAQAELVAAGTTPDLAQNMIPGQLVNMETLQKNTAPLPYTSVASGEWETRTTWTEPIVWDFPNSTGINGEAIEWNIVRTAHNINSGNKNIRVLGLLSQSGTLDIFNPSGSHNQSNTGQFLSISHYLLLNGIIDLTGESQLLQDVGSIVDPASSGYLERDQQGTANSFNYNYWSFPVSSGASNAGGSIRGLLKDGSNSNAPGDISFGYDHTYADNYDYNTGAKRISGYWLFKFFGTANVYGEWKWIGENGQLNTGDGFTMKGTSGAVPIATRQNYVFRGLPNNGPVDGLSIGANQNRLTGNPYPSALDAKQFILDNLNSADVSGATNTRNIFNGALYFWDHFGEENTHILREYVGGYATINLAGAVASATSSDERINDNDTSSTKRPGQFVPVGQGFFINTVLDESIKNGISIPGGEVVFSNAQRAFVTETNPADSYFLKPIYPSKKQKTVSTKDSRYKIRLNFTSPQGYFRQILVTADANTTNGFDLGYDAPLMDDLSEDMYWVIRKGKFVIQGAPDFNFDQNLPIGLKISEEKEFTIAIGALENLPDITDIYLLDTRDSTYHDLRKEAYKASLPVGEYQDLYELVFDDVTTAREDKEPGEGPIDYFYSLENSEFIISNPELHKIDHINIYNIAGQLVDQHFGIPDIKEIHIPQKKSLSSAVYIVKVYTSAGDYAKKVIIRKN